MDPKELESQGKLLKVLADIEENYWRIGHQRNELSKNLPINVLLLPVENLKLGTRTNTLLKRAGYWCVGLIVLAKDIPTIQDRVYWITDRKKKLAQQSCEMIQKALGKLGLQIGIKFPEDFLIRFRRQYEKEFPGKQPAQFFR